VDGIAQTDATNLGSGSAVKNVLHGAQTYTFYNLFSATHYYFAIYAYTNSGININYKLVPDAPTVDITTQSLALPLAAWTFDATVASPATPTSVAANFGLQASTAMLYADGTNGSSAWLQSTELNAFSGTVINDPREGTNILSGKSYCPVHSSANGKSMVIAFTMTDYKDPIMTYATQRTASGFTTQQWAWSTDNVTYTDFASITSIAASFETKTLDMSTINQLDQAATVYLRVTFTGATTTSGNNRLDNIVIRGTEVPHTKTLRVKQFVEGLFNTATGLMNQASGTSSAQFGTDIADTIRVELHNATTPFDVVYTYNNVDLGTDGMAIIPTIPGTISGSYYVVIRHRNSLETWSANPVDFSVASPIEYDFTTAAGQAFGNNLKSMGSVYAIWGGDVTQDGLVDGSDLAAVDNASLSVLMGYNAEDVNGDGLVDGSDMALIDNNSLAVIQLIKP
jgi:hypothetical protein